MRKSKIPDKVEKLKDTYLFLLPHQISIFRDQIKDFYKEIHFTKGVESPDIFIKDIIETVRSSPYQFFLVAVDKDGKPLGYTWYYVDVNIIGQSYLSIEHDYIVPEHRFSLRGARVQKKFIEFIVDTSKKCNCEYTNTVVRSDKLKESREKMGFQVVEYKMRFDGTGQDFVAQNPIFARYVTI